MKIRYALAALCLVSLSALAAEPQMKPDPMLRKLDVWARTWTCKGTDNWPKPHATRATATGKWTLDGRWLDFHYTQEKTKENPMPFSGAAYMGYDPMTKKFMTGWVDSTGGYEVSSSSGWNGDTMVMEGTYNGMGGGKMKDTFTMKGNTLHHLTQVEQKGKWETMTDETCTK